MLTSLTPKFHLTFAKLQNSTFGQRALSFRRTTTEETTQFCKNISNNLLRWSHTHFIKEFVEKVNINLRIIQN